jgi:hypothetical protein
VKELYTYQIKNTPRPRGKNIFINLLKYVLKVIEVSFLHWEKQEKV